RIECTPSEGSGQLVLLRHSWLTTGPVPPTSGSYLRVEVELTCTGGSLDYDPYNFQVFDQTGKLFETAIEGAGDSMLDTGTLRPGERVRGTIAFDMPRSEATLLMSDNVNQAVTALKGPGAFSTPLHCARSAGPVATPTLEAATPRGQRSSLRITSFKPDQT